MEPSACTVPSMQNFVELIRPRSLSHPALSLLAPLPLLLLVDDIVRRGITEETKRQEEEEEVEVAEKEGKDGC